MSHSRFGNTTWFTVLAVWLYNKDRFEYFLLFVLTVIRLDALRTVISPLMDALTFHRKMTQFIRNSGN